jgi:hypothetical protein
VRCSLHARLPTIDPAITPVGVALLEEEAWAGGPLVDDGVVGGTVVLGGMVAGLLGDGGVTGEGAPVHLSNLNHIGPEYWTNVQFPTSASITRLLGPARRRKETEVELHDTACKNVGKPGGGPNGRRGPGDSSSSLNVKGLVGIAVLTTEHLASSYTVTRRTT